MRQTARRLILSGFGLGALANDAGAQGAVTGVVYDSVAAQPLAAAFVQLALMSDPSVSRSVRADSRGRFRLDSVTAGSWVLAVMHPRIDSLGIEQLVRLLTTQGVGEQRTTVAIPSARTLVREVCGDNITQDPTGYLHGRLRTLAGGRDSAPGAVDVQWVDMTVSVTEGVGVTRTPRRLVVSTVPDGAFTVCGLPPGGTVRVRGMRGTDTTGIVELLVPDHGIARLDMAVGPVRHVAVAATTKADDTRINMDSLTDSPEAHAPV